MSWSIALRVENGEATVTNVTKGGPIATPPDGDYTINGHVFHGNDAQPSLGLMTPMGGVNVYLTEKAVDVPAEAETATDDVVR